MRKHNVKFARRWQRTRPGGGLDTSNFPQLMSHKFANDKGTQLFANGLLRSLIQRVVQYAPA